MMDWSYLFLMHLRPIVYNYVNVHITLKHLKLIFYGMFSLSTLTVKE